jgi:CubicO group peptidase (beta-lactamase class C family)
MDERVAACEADLQSTMERAVTVRGIPGIVVAAGDSERLLVHRHMGWAQVEGGRRPAGLDTVWDLASLTKVVATTTLAAIAMGDGCLGVDDPIGRYLPEFRDREPARVTIRELMTHTSGFVWWRPYYTSCRSRAEVLAVVFQEDLVSPRGEKQAYSDLNYILLGEIVARVLGAPLDVAARERVFGPLGMSDTCFNPTPDLRARCAATEVDAETNQPWVGVVHDENARAMGGVSGHAGLFSTGYDLARFARMMLREGEPLISHAAFRQIMTRDVGSASGTRWLGWDGTKPGQYLGDVFGERAFGHTGFTGTSIWHDPDADFFVTVLTNGVHPVRRQDDAMMHTRMECYEAALALVRALRETWAG